MEVPLQKGKEIGCVVKISDESPDSGNFEVKEIFSHVSPDYHLSDEILDLAKWIGDYYFCSLGEALSTASMLGFSEVKPSSRKLYKVSLQWRDQVWQPRHFEILKALSQIATLESLSSLAKSASTTVPTLRKIAEKGGLVEAEEVPPLPAQDDTKKFTESQVTAFNTINDCLEKGRFSVFLLHGVTGSGKTEVYLRLIDEVLKKGKTALCLVPEISLTPQTVERFSSRFQTEIGIFHSQMTRVEKLNLFHKITDGRIRIVIGARSAVFSPLPNLGIIIVDEEHEGSYKQKEIPRYHARDTAIMRASRLKIPILLGSATPSFESYQNATSGKYHLLQIRERPDGLLLPKVELVPMGKSLTQEIESEIGLISPVLKSAIEKRLQRKEQSLLFLNRRGFSNFLFCPSCHWVARCDEDDVALTVHKRKRRGDQPNPDSGPDLFHKEESQEVQSFLKCHFCAKTSPVPKSCPKCQNEKLVTVGMGTQRIEELIQETFPTANLLRLDQDTITSRRAFLDAWEKMVSGEADIILGTQMIAKGIHLEGVTLVGVILADVGIFIPDFRADERTFSLLTQVSGRTGRTQPGEVIIQTYMPHHAAIRLAADHDYEGFYEQESRRREQWRFPPFSRLIAITISDKDPTKAQQTSLRLSGLLRRIRNQPDFYETWVIGPRPAPIERLAGLFRRRILIRSQNNLVAARLLRKTMASKEWYHAASTRVSIDVDPIDLM